MRRQWTGEPVCQQWLRAALAPNGLRRQVWSGRRWLRWPARLRGMWNGRVVRRRRCSERLRPSDGRPSSDGGVVSCVAKSCVEQSLECGLAGDGCGNQIDCGTCGSGVCGGGGVPSHCGNTQSCVPTQSFTLCAGKCGKIADGCGGVVDCDVCAPGQICGANEVPNVCGTPAGAGAALSIGRPCARESVGSWQTGAAVRTTAVDAKPPQRAEEGGPESLWRNRWMHSVARFCGVLR